MKITDKRIDFEKAFDWGMVSDEYAKYRDIYPEVFYKKIAELGFCINNQNILDIGTGTGVLPRNMYHYGAKWIGTDISENQILMAKKMAKSSKMDIKFLVSSAENLDFPNNTFDCITACQCFWYFKHEEIMPKLYNMLKRNGKLVILYMGWLPFEDEVLRKSEDIILKYNPKWSGANEIMKKNAVPKCAFDYFSEEYHNEFKTDVVFTKENWHGRMKACRGVGASLNKEEIKAWEFEHKKMLETLPTDEISIKHFIAITVLSKK